MAELKATNAVDYSGSTTPPDYKCKNCGATADQNSWFPEFPLDDHPLEEKLEAKPCEGCVKKLEAEINPEGWRLTQDQIGEINELAERPAELEETPVVIPA